MSTNQARNPTPPVHRPGARPPRWIQRLIERPQRALRDGMSAEDHLSGGTRLLVAGYLLTRSLRDSDLLVRAGNTAYTFVFALVPLLTTALAVVAAFPGVDARREELKAAMYQYLLPGAAQEVQIYLEQFIQAATAAGAVSSLVFLTTILLLFQNLETTYNLIWKSERSRTWGERLQVLALFFLLWGVATTVIVIITSQTHALTTQMETMTGAQIYPGLKRLGFEITNLMAGWVVFSISNRMIPLARVAWRPAIASGVLIGTVWYAFKWAFSWYVANISSYGSIYGALSLVPVFFLWLYLTIVLLLIGAQLSYVLQNLRALLLVRRFAGREVHPLAFYAVEVVCELARAYANRDGPSSLEALRTRTGIGEFFLREAITALVASDLALEVVQGETRAYLLTVPASTLTPGEVVRTVSGEWLEVPVLPASTFDGKPEQEVQYQRLAALFRDAVSEQGNALEALTIAELAGLAEGTAVPAPTAPDTGQGEQHSERSRS